MQRANLAKKKLVRNVGMFKENFLQIWKFFFFYGRKTNFREEEWETL